VRTARRLAAGARERPEDIPPLVEHFLQEAAKLFGKDPPTAPKELFAYLATYPFPGNVRELRSMVLDAVARHERGVLSLGTFFQHMDETGRGGVFHPTADDVLPERITFGRDLPTLKEATIRLFREALRRAEGNQSVAARMLGVSRRTINRYVASGVLDVNSHHDQDDDSTSNP
jgi:DNA-binding NtrC family response regulator